MARINSNLCIFLVFLSHVSIFVPMGLNLTALNPSTPAIEVFINTTYQDRYNVSSTPYEDSLYITLGQASLIVGAAIGSFSVHWFTHLLSRRSGLIVVHVLAIISSVVMSLVAYLFQSFEAIIVGRLINGIARGLGFSLGPIYVAEIVSRKTLALYQSPLGWIMQLSSALGNVIAHPKVLGGVDTWPIALGFPGIFSVAFICALPWVPHTVPDIMKREEKKVTQSKDPENLASFRMLKTLRHTSNEQITEEFNNLKSEIANDSMVEKASVLQLVSIGKYRRQLIAAIVVQFGLQACGIQAVMQYTNTLFEAAGVNPDHSTYYTIGIFALMAVVVFLSSGLLSKYGCKRMILCGFGVVLLGLLMLVVSTNISGTFPTMRYVSVGGVAVSITGCAIGPMLVLSSYPSELTTTRTRPNALWLAGIVFWCTAVLVALTMPFLLAAWGGYAYLPFMVLVVVVAAYIFFRVPDTRNLTVEQIQRHFEGRSASRENEEPGEKLLLTPPKEQQEEKEVEVAMVP